MIYSTIDHIAHRNRHQTVLDNRIEVVTGDELRLFFRFYDVVDKVGRVNSVNGADRFSVREVRAHAKKFLYDSTHHDTTRIR